MDLSFNILDCFDENVPNLDLTKNYIYVLMLVEDKYYVGRKQLALGYTEYISSDEFKFKIKKYNEIRRQNNGIKIENKKKVNIETNVDLLNIKQNIRNKILNAI